MKKDKVHRAPAAETQIIKAIKEHENGRNAQELCRELGITTAAFYNRGGGPLQPPPASPGP